MPLGITSKLYINIGTAIVPVWSEVNLISDLVVAADWNEGEASARLEQIQTFEPTNMALGLTGKVRKNITDTSYLLLRTAHRTRGILDVLVLDGDRTTNGSDGFRFDCKVTKWSEDQGLQQVIFKEFEIKPCIPSNLPQTVLVAGGVLTYAAIGG